ncbi:MAG: response regulator, partial [Rhodospirillaceae bacterium]|nr:response regulator [Rhodospirillaceae bacterium]MBT5667384.1 response regulator [Rhodospirillaceae bacterium]
KLSRPEIALSSWVRCPNNSESRTGGLLGAQNIDNMQERAFYLGNVGLKQVRADERLKTMPFIMITAESKTENVIAAKQAGVNNYIVKPFNAATLKTKMSSVIGQF